MEWYRKTSWTENDENDFFEKLKRAREYSRAQYLRIQAVTLISTENPNLLSVAEDLLNKMLSEFPNERGQQSPALNSLGDIYKIRGNYDKAIEYYKKSLKFEEDFPNTITNSYLDFSELIVKMQKTDEYDYAEKLLENEIPESLFPVTKYKGFTILAIINYHKGNYDKAKIYENLAEENAKFTINKKSKVIFNFIVYAVFWIDFLLTEKVFAKGGLNWTKSSISTELSKLLFQIVKLQKNTI